MMIRPSPETIAFRSARGTRVVLTGAGRSLKAQPPAARTAFFSSGRIWSIGYGGAELGYDKLSGVLLQGSYCFLRTTIKIAFSQVKEISRTYYRWAEKVPQIYPNSHNDGDRRKGWFITIGAETHIGHGVELMSFRVIRRGPERDL